MVKVPDVPNPLDAVLTGEGLQYRFQGIPIRLGDALMSDPEQKKEFDGFMHHVRRLLNTSDYDAMGKRIAQLEKMLEKTTQQLHESEQKAIKYEVRSAMNTFFEHPARKLEGYDLEAQIAKEKRDCVEGRCPIGDGKRCYLIPHDYPVPRPRK